MTRPVRGPRASAKSRRWVRLVVPTSRSRQPARTITSGTRNEPPISTSSPRETTTSLRIARAFSTSRTAAALLLTTTAASAPVRRQIRPSTWSSRSPPCPGGEIEFQVARLDHHGGHGLGGGARQERPAEIGVQHRAGEVEDRPQGHPPLGRKVLRNRLTDRRLVRHGAPLRTDPGEDGPHGCGDGRAPIGGEHLRRGPRRRDVPPTGSGAEPALYLRLRLRGSGKLSLRMSWSAQR